MKPVYLFRIGKESNRYEEVERGEIRELDEVQEILENPRATAWKKTYMPLLKRLSASELAGETGIAESLLIRYRKGQVRPRLRLVKRLMQCLKSHFAKTSQWQ